MVALEFHCSARDRYTLKPQVKRRRSFRRFGDGRRDPELCERELPKHRVGLAELHIKNGTLTRRYCMGRSARSQCNISVSRSLSASIIGVGRAGACRAMFTSRARRNKRKAGSDGCSGAGGPQ